MKRFLLFVLGIGTMLNCWGQVAQWLVPAQYNNIYLDHEARTIVADSASVKVIFALDGTRLFATSNDVAPFADGCAVATLKGSNIIAGVYSATGAYAPLDGCTVAHNQPSYSCGNLVVRKDNFMRIVNKDGVVYPTIYASLFPFFNGYAAGTFFRNLEKMKDITPVLVNHFGKAVNFAYNDKVFKPEDVDFVSSVNDENKGIVVIKNRVYIFNGEDGTLSPVFATRNAVYDLKNQAKVEDDVLKSIAHDTQDGSARFSARCGKLGEVWFTFDSLMRLTTITRTDSEYTYKISPRYVQQLTTLIQPWEDNGKWGLKGGADVLLPAQFDKVIACFDNTALVSLNGRCGVVAIDRNANFAFRLNNGDDIPFRHRRFETTLSCDMPQFVSTDNVMLDVTGNNQCELDLASKASRTTDVGNFVQYNCSLTIPSDLTEELSTLTYNVQVTYDGLKSLPIALNVKACHYKYFSVEIDDEQTTVKDGIVEFPFSLKADSLPTDGIYSIEVSVATQDSVVCVIEKVSESIYKCRLSQLDEGINKIDINVDEQGCPTMVFPFEVYYTKAVESTRSTPAQPEEVTILRSTKKRLRISRPIPVVVETIEAPTTTH